MESKEVCKLQAGVGAKSDACKQALAQDPEKWRRQCGCLRTSDKLKEILKAFPAPPPPTPAVAPLNEKKSLSAYCIIERKQHFVPKKLSEEDYKYNECKLRDRKWEILADLVHLVQLSVTATALALYYVIYCYMQLIYYMLRSALYFHNADGPMKITIGVVTLTSVIIGVNLLIRMEKMVGIYIF